MTHLHTPPYLTANWKRCFSVYIMLFHMDEDELKTFSWGRSFCTELHVYTCADLTTIEIHFWLFSAILHIKLMTFYYYLIFIVK